MSPEVRYMLIRYEFIHVLQHFRKICGEFRL